MNEIDRHSKRYVKQGLFIAVGIFLICLLLMRLIDNTGLLIPAVISVSFSLIFDVVDALLWRKVAMKDASYLPTFYTGVSGFRMLAALVVMFIYYLVAGRAAMLEFFLVFISFYLVLLVHHTIFFMRVSNDSCETLKADKTQ